MIAFDVVVHEAWRSTDEQLLNGFFDELRSRGSLPIEVLSLTVFVHAPNAAAHEARCSHWEDLVRTAFQGAPPPLTITAQAPEHGMLIEAKVLRTRGVRVTRRRHEACTYTLVTGYGTRQVHAAVRCAFGSARDTERRSHGAFARMRSILNHEAMDFGDVVRQWNTIENLLGTHSEITRVHQVYQDFNEARALAYALDGHAAGYPAATGIGQRFGGVAIECLAFTSRDPVLVEPIANPSQRDAHHYSSHVLVGTKPTGVTTRSRPLFERAKRVATAREETTFVSGTAAILGERSIAPGNVVAQTHLTLHHIARLILGRRLSCLRAYVKRRDDLARVRAICEHAYPGVPAVYVQADVCRPELLVEIEGAVLAVPCGGTR
ncbi:MAG: hypothetical protein H6834_12335 [Planctomycetes bacterium]|nr:hypothetical protein [Planctomycetota bacterium]